MEKIIENNIQEQMSALDKKLDLVLEEVYAQKQSRIVFEDLVSDLSLIGKDVYKATTTELDKAGLEIDSEAIQLLGFKFLRNIDTITEMFGMLESANDLMKDMAPIVKQVGIDTVHKLHDFEQKGYFEFVQELGNLLDNIITHFSKEDVKMLSDNIVTILETVKSITQPEMLKAINNGLTIFKSLDTESIPEYSIWKVMKELNSPEMKKGIGFMITFLKNIASETNNNKI